MGRTANGNQNVRSKSKGWPGRTTARPWPRGNPSRGRPGTAEVNSKRRVPGGDSTWPSPQSGPSTRGAACGCTCTSTCCAGSCGNVKFLHRDTPDGFVARLPVRVVKPDLLHQDVHGEFVEHPVESRKLPQGGIAPPLHRVVHNDREGNRHEGLVYQNAPYHLRHQEVTS